MPPEIKNDQALDLKKRARRRLVGAIALVLLMIIILPMILKDRAVPEAPKDDIKISMPETAPVTQETPTPTQDVTPLPAPVLPESITSTLPNEIVSTPTVSTSNEELVKPVESKPVEIKSAEVKPVEVKPAQVRPAEVKLTQPKPAEPKPDEDKSAKGDFTIQIGAFSDAAKVAQLQAKLKEAGFASRTEKISTSKGENIRLRVGKYGSRQEAAEALTSLNKTGMTGMVITNK